MTAFTITRAGGESVSTKPRTTITLPLFVQNNTSKSRECIAEVILPENWKTVLTPMPFSLAPSESTMALVSIFVPRGMEAGMYYVTYKVMDKNKPAVTDFLIILVEVLAAHHIVVEHIDAPSYVIAGNSFTSTFTVMNRGNTTARITLFIYCMDDLPYSVEPIGKIRNITLPPASIQHLSITVETEPGMKDILIHRLEVKAKVETASIGAEQTNNEDQITDRAYSKTDIIPRVSGKAGLYHLLPVTTGIKGEVFYNDNFGAQETTTVRSKGSIDENSIHNIDLRIDKAVNTSDDLLMNPEDFYFLRYWNPLFEVYLGDATFNLSPLLEKYATGRGAGTSFFLGPFKIGSYYRRDLPRNMNPAGTGEGTGETPEEENGQDTDQHTPGENGRDHAAGFAEYSIFDPTFPEGIRYKAGLNFYSTFYNSIILSLQQKYRPVRFMDFDLEVASGLDVWEGSPSGYAVHFEGNGGYKLFTCKLTGVYADSLFPGTYRDLYIVSGNFGLHFLSNRLKFKTTYKQQQRNLSLNTDMQAPLERNILANCSYSFGKDLTSLSLSWKYQNKVDQFPEPEYKSHDNGIHLTVTQPLGIFTLDIDGEYRYVFDTIDDYHAHHHKYNSSLSITPDEKTVYSFSLGYNGDYHSDTTPIHKLTADAHYHYDIRDLIFDAQLKSVNVIQDWDIKYFSLGAVCGLTYTLFKDHKLSVNSAYTISNSAYTRVDDDTIGGSASGLEHDAYLILEYKAPFSIPISKKKSIGSVHGSIVDTRTGKGVENVIVQLGGHATVTNSNGQFVFNAVKPGTHYINIDRSGIRQNYIPTIKLPLKVIVEKGKNIDVEISVIEGAQVNGQVLLFTEDVSFVSPVVEEEGKDSGMTGSGFPNILLELTNGEIVMRRLSDKHGYFSFDEVLPGKWELKVVSDNYPEYHYIEKDSFDLNLLEGDQVEVEFKILPEERTIAFLNTEDTLYIRPPDEDMKYELEWKLDPEDLTPEPTPSPTPSPEEEPTPDPGETGEPTEEPTPVPTRTQTPSPSPEKSTPPEPTPHITGKPTAEPVETHIPGPTPETTSLPDETAKPTPEITPLPEETTEPSPETTPLPEETAEPSPEPEITVEPEETETPEPSPTIAETPITTTSPIPESTDEPTETSTAQPTPQATPVPTETPTTIPTPQITPSPTETPTIQPTSKVTPAPSEVPVTPAPSPVPTNQPTPLVTTTPAVTRTATVTPKKTPVPTKKPAETPAPTAIPGFEDVPPPVVTLVPDGVPQPTATIAPDEIPPPKETIPPDTEAYNEKGDVNIDDEFLPEIPQPKKTMAP